MFARRVVAKIRIGRIGTVVAYARQRPCLVGSVAHGEQFIADPQIFADAKPEAVLQGYCPPQAHDILMASHFDRIPARLFGVPQVEVVVMHPHAHEVFGAYALGKAGPSSVRANSASTVT